MSLLICLGPIQFEIEPLNLTGYDHAHSSAFAEKPVLGAPMPLEWVGEGPESWSFTAKLFPHRFGGLDDLKRLQQARAAGQPIYLMRGDGEQMGWVVIESVSEQASFLDSHGIGKVIAVDIKVKRSTKPSAGSYFSIFSGALL